MTAHLVDVICALLPFQVGYDTEPKLVTRLFAYWTVSLLMVRVRHCAYTRSHFTRMLYCRTMVTDRQDATT